MLEKGKKYKKKKNEMDFPVCTFWNNKPLLLGQVKINT